MIRSSCVDSDTTYSFCFSRSLCNSSAILIAVRTATLVRDCHGHTDRHLAHAFVYVGGNTLNVFCFLFRLYRILGPTDVDTYRDFIVIHNVFIPVSSRCLIVCDTKESSRSVFSS